MPKLTTVLLALLPLAPAALSAQIPADTVLLHRWVGTHDGRPLVLEFYDDTMLVVNDRYPLSYRLTPDSIIGFGDTTVVARWWMSVGRLILETPSGEITMAELPPLARPVAGRWTGGLGDAAGTNIELQVFANGTARWRTLPEGAWTQGEWDREARVLTFTWHDADETDWSGQYDPIGNAILFEQTVPGSGTSILRRAFR
jgi:hypothetical protein